MMNEHLKELETQAKEYAWSRRDDELLNTNLDTIFREKFAELIINKCANIVWDEAEKISSAAVNDVGYKIIEYFHGVEK